MADPGFLDPIDGFPFPQLIIDRGKMDVYMAAAVNAGIDYGFGAKAPEDHLCDFPPAYAAIDCSGFSRCLLTYATNCLDVIPDGSWVQQGWCRQQGFKMTQYSSAAGNHDDVVRIAFHLPDSQDAIGHVWLIMNGVTYESYGGNGPGQRDWDTQRLLDLVTDCFVLALPPPG